MTIEPRPSIYDSWLDELEDLLVFTGQPSRDRRRALAQVVAHGDDPRGDAADADARHEPRA